MSREIKKSKRFNTTAPARELLSVLCDCAFKSEKNMIDWVNEIYL